MIFRHKTANYRADITKMNKKSSLFFKKILYVGYLLTVVTIILELAYRSYIIDFYAAELRGLNAPALLAAAQNKKTILFCGDSFSAGGNGYVAQVRQALPEYRVINAAIPGSGIQETALLAPARIRRFKPAVFVYQLYVGNDLLDIHHPVNWQTLSVARNIYWSISDRLQSWDYINFRLAHWKYRVYDDTGGATDRTLYGKFDIAKYSAREKLYFKAEPGLVDDCSQLLNGRKGDFDQLLRGLDGILHHLDDSCRVILLVIPHCMQTNIFYRDNMLLLGAKSDLSTTIFDAEYPFLTQLTAHFKGNKNVEIINPLPDFRFFDSPEQRIYYENDPHLSPAGQALLSRMVLEKIKN